MLKIRAHRENIGLRDRSRLISDLLLEELTQKVAEMAVRWFSQKRMSNPYGLNLWLLSLPMKDQDCFSDFKCEQ